MKLQCISVKICLLEYWILNSRFFFFEKFLREVLIQPETTLQHRRSFYSFFTIEKSGFVLIKWMWNQEFLKCFKWLFTLECNLYYRKMEFLVYLITTKLLKIESEWLDLPLVFIQLTWILPSKVNKCSFIECTSKAIWSSNSWRSWLSNCSIT